MEQVRVTFEGREYTWYPHSSRWYGSADFIEPPVVVAQQLNRLVGFPKQAPEAPAGRPRKPKVTAGGSATRAQARQLEPSEIRSAIEAAVPDSEVRPYFNNTIYEIEQLAVSNPTDLALLMVLMVELRHRSTKKALLVRERVLDELVAGIDTYFSWPDTFAEGGDGSLDGGYFEYESGLLGFMGYHVGRTNGLPDSDRRRLLDDVFLGALPLVNSVEYMEGWGGPACSLRLQKIAESIASFTRSAKRRRNPVMAVAIGEWESDLEYLKRKYYVGKFGFGWPDIGV